MSFSSSPVLTWRLGAVVLIAREVIAQEASGILHSHQRASEQHCVALLGRKVEPEARHISTIDRLDLAPQQLRGSIGKVSGAGADEFANIGDHRAGHRGIEVDDRPAARQPNDAVGPFCVVMNIANRDLRQRPVAARQTNPIDYAHEFGGEFSAVAKPTRSVSRQCLLQGNNPTFEVVVAGEVLGELEPIDRRCVTAERPRCSLRFFGRENRRRRGAVDKPIAAPHTPLLLGQPFAAAGAQKRDRCHVPRLLAFDDPDGVFHQCGWVVEHCGIDLL